MSIKIDDANFGEFCKDFYPMVYRRCLAVLGRDKKEDAKDTAQDVFVKLQVLKSEGKLDGPHPLQYFSAMAANMSINKKNRERKLVNKLNYMATIECIKMFKTNWEEGQETWEIGITDNGYELVEAKIIIQAILDEQDETTLNIYHFKYRDNMTLEAIGEAVGLSISAVRKRIKKLERQVKEKMGDAGK